MNTLARLIANLFITTVLLYGLNFINWIHLYPRTLVPDSLLNALLACAILAALFTVVRYIIGKLYIWFALLTCGLGCLLLPVVLVGIGYATLATIAHFAPTFLSLTTNFWLNVFVGLLVSLIHIPEPETTKNYPKQS